MPDAPSGVPSGTRSGLRLTESAVHRHVIRTPSERDGLALELVAVAASVLAREPDGATLREFLCTSMATCLQVPLVAIASVHEGEVSALVGSTPLPERQSTRTLRAIMHTAATRRECLLSNEALDVIPGTCVAPQMLGWGSVVAVPVAHHAGHPLAVLLVAARSEHAFDAILLRALTIVSEQLAVAVDRAELLGRLAEWSNGMEALLAFSGSVHRHREPEALVQEMVEHASRFLKADGGYAGLTSVGEHGETRLVSTSYWSQNHWRRLPRTWARREGIPGRVLEHEFAYLTADYPADSARDQELVDHDGVHYAVCVPLRDASHQVVGFLELHRTIERAPFTWNDASFLEALADTTAMAIENSRLVTALASKNAEVRQLFALHADRIEEERQHIARELHDEAGQALVGVKLALQVLSRVLPSDTPHVRAPLDELRLQVNQATARFRQLARRLRPPALDQHGLAAALAQLVHDTEQRGGFAVHLEVDGLDQRRFPLHETAVFRIVQEALTNVTAHAGATEVRVSVGETAQRLLVRVSDDGCGFDITRSQSGLGLRGIAERAHQLGGLCDVASQPGTGTVVSVQLPLT